MLAQDARRAGSGHGAVKRVLDGIGLAVGRNDTDGLGRIHNVGHGQAHGALGHVVKGLEAAVVDLLLAADVVQLDDLDDLGVIEVGHGGIVEGQVAVLANAKEDIPHPFIHLTKVYYSSTIGESVLIV